MQGLWGELKELEDKEKKAIDLTLGHKKSYILANAEIVNFLLAFL